jgi:hypothetical protein
MPTVKTGSGFDRRADREKDKDESLKTGEQSYVKGDKKNEKKG